jgi:aminoglycoside N3'-acetyltransferase
MFSCLILGKKKNYYSNNSNNSFGPGSIFEKLLIQNAKLVSFGLNRFDPTFVHYVEQFFDTNFKKINYRYLKKISGIIIKDKKRYKDNYFTFLRKKNNKFYNEKNIKKDLLKAKKLNWIKLLNTNIYIVKAKDFYNFGITGMKKNKNYFIK